VALTERLAHDQNVPSSSLNRCVLQELPDSHPVWDHAANALANLCVTLLLITSTEKIVLGGGVMKRKGLMEQVRYRTVQLLNGYLEMPDANDMQDLICFSEYGDDAGLMGAIVLAQQGLEEEEEPKRQPKSFLQKSYWNGFTQGFLCGAAMAVAAVTFLSSRRR